MQLKPQKNTQEGGWGTLRWNHVTDFSQMLINSKNYRGGQCRPAPDMSGSQWQEMGLTFQKRTFFLARESAHGKKKQRKKSEGFHGNSWEPWKTKDKWDRVRRPGSSSGDRVMRPGVTGSPGGLRTLSWLKAWIGEGVSNPERSTFLIPKKC